MNELFKNYDIELSSEQEKKFQDFLQIFMETNSQINLSAIRDEVGIIEKHFIDSIILKKFTSIEWKILDLWTGWGFPGIPLKIVDENNSDFTLVDSIDLYGNKIKIFTVK